MQPLCSLPQHSLRSPRVLSGKAQRFSADPTQPAEVEKPDKVLQLILKDNPTVEQLKTAQSTLFRKGLTRLIGGGALLAVGMAGKFTSLIFPPLIPVFFLLTIPGFFMAVKGVHNLSYAQKIKQYLQKTQTQ